EDDQGTVYAASANGLFRFSHEQWSLTGPDSGLAAGAVSGIHADSTGTMWVATPDGIFQRAKNESSFRLFDGATKVHAADFAEFPPGTVWRTDPEHGLTPV